ncbi:hypothetical protein [Sphingobium sp. BS19]|uniref:hypothetical protein n=1 Tax=Sphingobium sp. BS19 TaxID=3018973 RepID=UPI0024938B55|nr:hypothetical protein [Sphingobium sp. BS19]
MELAARMVGDAVVAAQVSHRYPGDGRYHGEGELSSTRPEYVHIFVGEFWASGFGEENAAACRFSKKQFPAAQLEGNQQDLQSTYQLTASGQASQLIQSPYAWQIASRRVSPLDQLLRRS